jgi:hypothetical protein
VGLVDDGDVGVRAAEAVRDAVCEAEAWGLFGRMGQRGESFVSMGLIWVFALLTFLENGVEVG